MLNRFFDIMYALSKEEWEQSRLYDPKWRVCGSSVTLVSLKTCKKGLVLSSSQDISPLLSSVVCLYTNSLQKVFRGCIKIIFRKRRDLEKIFTRSTMFPVDESFFDKSNFLHYWALMQRNRRTASVVTTAFLRQLFWKVSEDRQEPA